MGSAKKEQRGTTPARVAALEAAPGWAGQVDREALWQENLATLCAHVGEHGRLPLKCHPLRLGVWVESQRSAKKAMEAGSASSKMTPLRAAALEAVPGWAWDGRRGGLKRRLPDGVDS